MTKRSADSFHDSESTTPLRLSPQRIRNILTLDERVAAIKAFDCRPMYTKVAKMFNCSWEQIKNIIANRTAILEFYEATKNAERQNDPLTDEVRQRKIEFLGECVYEYIQRLQFHTKTDLSEELIRSKAFEFRDVIRIDSFMPNKAWINHFKATYNFSLSNRQITLTRTPPASLDLRDIMTFCTKQKLQMNPGKHVAPPVVNNLYRTSTKMALSHENEATAEELRQRRQRKLNFMERALLEYATRAKFHLKVTLDEELLCSTASTLKDMLKLENFHPSRVWLKNFKSRYNFDTIVQSNLASSTRTPPLSLDLKDILSYCSRLEKNSQISAADITKSNQNGPNILLKSKAQRPPMISVVPKSSLMPIAISAENTRKPTSQQSLRDAHKPMREFKEKIIDLDDDDSQEEDIKPELNDFAINEPRTEDDDGDEVKDEKDLESYQPPALKIRKIESMCNASLVNVGAGVAVGVRRGSRNRNRSKKETFPPPQSPGHWPQPPDNNDDILPKTVRNYADALKLLKPLEEFAMLEENFRAIGLLEQLESIFKNPPKKKDGF